MLGEGRKQEMCFLPVPTVDAEAPFNKEFCKLLFVGEHGVGGETAGTEAKNVVFTKSSGTDLIVDCGWFGIQPAE